MTDITAAETPATTENTATETPTTATCTFTQPIPFGKRTLDGLTFRRLAAGDLRGLALEGLQHLDTDLYLSIASRASTTHIVVQQLEAVTAADMGEMVQALFTIMQGNGAVKGDVVTLHRPITCEEGAIATLHFRPPTAGDLRGLRISNLLRLDVDTLLVLAQRCCTTKLDAADLAGMDASDLPLIGAVLTGFFA